MTTAGKPDVDSWGNFTYSIPIQVPPGTAGMVPMLSLNYSSKAGDGVEGYGWSIGGLPSITRCPTTVAQDGAGQHGGVNYQSTDRFCLDGQRLLLISGTYGADGSEYRTELESFSRIVAHGNQGSTCSGDCGPTYFTVYTKSGQILEFGNTTDSRILPVKADGSGTMNAVRVWAVDKVSDYAGNYYKVTYTNDELPTGQYYVSHIVYTYNGSTQTGYNSVWFRYAAGSRPDITPLYHAGALVKITKLLSDIQTYINNAGTGTPISDYKLTYENGSTTTHSRLKTVQRCDGSGTTCLAATTFTWQGGNLPAMSTTSATQGGLGPLPAFGDFNGDGLLDVLVNDDYSDGNYFCPANGQVYLGQSTPGSFVSGNYTAHYNYFPNQGDTWSTPTVYNGTACFEEATDALSKLNTPVVVDVDGDGYGDLGIDTTIWKSVSGHWIIANSTAIVQNNQAGKFTQTSIDGSFQYPFFLQTDFEADIFGWADFTVAADFDGDGRSDGFVIGPGGTASYAYLSNGDGTFQQDGGHTPLTSDPQTGDFDGDGCSDILGTLSNQFVLYFCHPAVSQASTPNWSGDTFTIGDFNGDGLSDVLAVNSTTGTGGMWLSTGTGFVQTNFTVPSSWWTTYSGIVAGDWNGDGKTDVALISGTGGTPDKFEESTGTGFVDLNTFGSGNGAAAIPGDWNNDGGAGVYIWQTATQYTFPYTPEMIQKVDNGIGGTISITYDRLNNNDGVYTKDTNASYPTKDLDGPIYVVEEIDTGNGLGVCDPLHTKLANCFSTNYAYEGAKTDQSGRGFLGFYKITATDFQTNVVTTTTYNQVFPYIGTVASQTRKVGTLVLSTVTNTYKSLLTGPQTFVYLDKTVSSGKEVDGTTLPTTTALYENDDGTIAYDGYGNLLHEKVSVSGGSYTTTDNQYCNVAAPCDDDPANKWIIGRLTSTSVTRHVTSSTITRYSTASYNSNGILNQTIAEPNANTCNSSAAPTACALETDYTTIDPYGHPTAATVSGVGFTSRSTSVGYDSKGVFETSATNAKTQTEYWTYATTAAAGYGIPAAFGEPDSHTDINNQTTTWTYDTFGHMRLETLPGGSIGMKTDVQYFYCSGFNGNTTTTCPANGAFMVQVTPENNGGVSFGAVTLTYYDALSRVIRVDTQGYQNGSQTCGNPCWIRKDTVYDQYGHVSETSRPYFVTGGTAVWTTADYTVTAAGADSGDQDPYGRIWKITYPDSPSTSESYAFTGLGSTGTQTTFTDRRGKSTVTVKNPVGLVSSVTNAKGKITSYLYDAFGDLKRVTDPAGNQINNTFDIRGNKLTSSDPDMGAWSYTYDALGELTGQTDAKGQASSLTYDPLGRVTERDEPDQINTWSYDTATYGVGKLYQETAKVPGGSVYYTRTQSYIGNAGFPGSTVININGTNYTYTYGWHSNDRIATIQFPSGYIAYEGTVGFDLAQIVDTTSGGTPRWTANFRDAERRLTWETAGNNVTTVRSFASDTDRISQIVVGVGGSNSLRQFDYQFDATGNLLYRTDSLGSYTENFCYDDVNRLQNYAIGASGSSNCLAAKSGFHPRSTTYDDNTGNIATKSDIASTATWVYNYPTPGSARPHAVSSISGTVDGAANPVFTYDLNGNMTCEYTGSSCSSGAVKTETWTSFNMVKTITQGTGTINSTLTYDSDHHRIVQHFVNGSTTADTIYLNDPVTGAQSEVSVAGGTTTWHDYIKADGVLVAERSCTGATPCSTGETWNYFARDHLGSISVITDATGAALSTGGQLSFDPWGRQRNVDGTDDTSCSLPATEPTTRGFTAQEALPSYCLVNLNARVYDPTIGRMMSPDSIVPDPFDSESFNRYSYVDNGPLSAIDPSGHVKCSADGSKPCQQIKPIGYTPTPYYGNSDSMPCWGCYGPGIWGFSSQGFAISASFAGWAINNPGSFAAFAAGLGAGSSSNFAGAGSAGGVGASGTSDLQSIAGVQIEPPQFEGSLDAANYGDFVGQVGGIDTVLMDAYRYPYSDNLGLNWSLGGTYMFAPGLAISGQCERSGCYGIGGFGEGYSGKGSIDILAGRGIHSQSPNYKGGLGLAANATVGLPVAAAIDTIFGTTVFQAAHGMTGPVGVDITAFVNLSGGHLNSSLDIDLVPAAGQSAVVGVGYDDRH